MRTPGWVMPNGYDFSKEFKVVYHDFTNDITVQKSKITDCTDKLEIRQETTDIIINGIGTDPFAIPIHILLAGKRFEYFIESITAISEDSQVHLMLSKQEKKIVDQIEQRIKHHKNINLYSLSPAYPQGHPEILYKTIHGCFPDMKTDCNKKTRKLTFQNTEIIAITMLLREMGYIYSISCWDEKHKAWNQGVFNLHKTKFHELFDVYKKKFPHASLERSRVICGGIFCGREIIRFDNIVTPRMSPITIIPKGDTRDFLPSLQRHLLSSEIYTTNLYGEERECVNCGWCTDVCPIELNVRGLYKDFLNSRLKETERMRLFDCIECGLCTYICPAKIELMNNLIIAKHIITNINNSAGINK